MLFQFQSVNLVLLNQLMVCPCAVLGKLQSSFGEKANETIAFSLFSVSKLLPRPPRSIEVASVPKLQNVYLYVTYRVNFNRNLSLHSLLIVEWTLLVSIKDLPHTSRDSTMNYTLIWNDTKRLWGYRNLEIMVSFRSL